MGILREKLVHSVHIEDCILLGKENIDKMLDHFQYLNDLLSGKDDEKHVVSCKIDGAPSILMSSGHNHFTNIPFVATKGLFAQRPKYYSYDREIDESDSPDGLKIKLKAALKLAKAKIIPEGQIWQGDMLFTSGDVKKVTLEEVDYLMFKPNTLAYLVLENSKAANIISKAQIGVAFHTRYDSDLFMTNDIRASEAINVPKWAYVIDAQLPNISGIKFDDVESSTLSEMIETLNKKCNLISTNSQYDDLVNNEDFIQFYFMTLQNHKYDIEEVMTAEDIVESLHAWITKKISKRYQGLEKLKTTTGRDNKRDKIDSTSKELHFIVQNNEGLIKHIAEALSLATELKLEFTIKLEQANDWITKIETQNGFEPTGGEGFVVSEIGGDIIKLVDRSAFSHYNRSVDVIKGWESDNRSKITEGMDENGQLTFSFEDENIYDKEKEVVIKTKDLEHAEEIANEIAEKLSESKTLKEKSLEPFKSSNSTKGLKDQIIRRLKQDENIKFYYIDIDDDNNVIIHYSHAKDKKSLKNPQQWSEVGTYTNINKNDTKNIKTQNEKEESLFSLEENDEDTDSTANFKNFLLAFKECSDNFRSVTKLNEISKELQDLQNIPPPTQKSKLESYNNAINKKNRELELFKGEAFKAIIDLSQQKNASNKTLGEYLYDNVYPYYDEGISSLIDDCFPGETSIEKKKYNLFRYIKMPNNFSNDNLTILEWIKDFGFKTVTTLQVPSSDITIRDNLKIFNKNLMIRLSGSAQRKTLDSIHIPELFPQQNTLLQESLVSLLLSKRINGTLKDIIEYKDIDINIENDLQGDSFNKLQKSKGVPMPVITIKINEYAIFSIKKLSNNSSEFSYVSGSFTNESRNILSSLIKFNPQVPQWQKFLSNWAGPIYNMSSDYTVEKIYECFVNRSDFKNDYIPIHSNLKNNKDIANLLFMNRYKMRKDSYDPSDIYLMSLKEIDNIKKFFNTSDKITEYVKEMRGFLVKKQLIGISLKQIKKFNNIRATVMHTSTDPRMNINSVSALHISKDSTLSDWTLKNIKYQESGIKVFNLAIDTNISHLHSRRPLIISFKEFNPKKGFPGMEIGYDSAAGLEGDKEDARGGRLNSALPSLIKEVFLKYLNDNDNKLIKKISSLGQDKNIKIDINLNEKDKLLFQTLREGISKEEEYNLYALKMGAYTFINHCILRNLSENGNFFRNLMYNITYYVALGLKYKIINKNVEKLAEIEELNSKLADYIKIS